jgi:hypothetical protein
MMLVGQAVARHRSNKAVSKSVNPRDHLGPLGSHLKAEVLEYPMIEFGIWARSVKERVRFRAILVLELVADLGDTVRWDSLLEREGFEPSVPRKRIPFQVRLSNGSAKTKPDSGLVRSGSVPHRVSRCCGVQDCIHGAAPQDLAV